MEVEINNRYWYNYISMDWTAKYFDDLYARFFLENLDEKRTSEQVSLIIGKTGLEKGSAVADLGCGLGRHMLEFARRGFEATGYDFNETYILKARETAEQANLENASFVCQDSRKFSETAKFDLVTSLWTSFGYFDDATNTKILSQIARSLKPNGQVVIDIENREYIIRHFIVDRYKDKEGFLILERNHFDPATSVNRCHRTFVHPDGARTTYNREIRLFTLTEMLVMGKSVGIEFNQVYGDWDGKAYGLEVPRMILFGRLKQ